MSFVPVTDSLSFVLSCLLGPYFLLLFGSMWHFLWILIDQAIYRGITPLETWRSPVKVDRFSSPAVFINPDAALPLPIVVPVIEVKPARGGVCFVFNRFPECSTGRI